MAHYAELNDNNEVIYVTYMDNKIITDDDGNEIEELGINHLHRHHGNNRRWIRTSYNDNFRGNYAGIGYIYREDLDMFVLPSGPYPSWVLNESTGKWESPVAKKDEYFNDYEWKEDLQTWFSIKEYVFEKYATNYQFSDIEEVVNKFNLEDNKLITIWTTDDYLVRLEKVKNFIVSHVSYSKWNSTVMNSWKYDYSENIIKNINSDLFIIHKTYSPEHKSNFYNYMEVAIDFEFLEEKDEYIICKRNKN